MKYTLHIAFDEDIGDAVLRTCEYVKKYGEYVSPYFEPLLMEKSGDGATIMRPEKNCPISDMAIRALEIYYQIPLHWAVESKKEHLANGNEIEDYFEQKYAHNILEDSPVEAELHLMLYVPLFKEGVAENVRQVVDNLAVSQKYVVNVLAIPYDIAQACGLKHPSLSREERYRVMLGNAEALAALSEENTRLRHIFTFQNYNANKQSKNFDFKKFVKTCGELSMALIEHYDVVCHYSVLDRPFYAINVDSMIIDKYLIVDRWFRELFQENVKPNIIDDDTLDKERVRDTYRRILKEEASLLKDYKQHLTNSLESQAEYDKLFTKDVKNRIREILRKNIEEDSLNIAEQRYLFSLFNQITTETDFESEDLDDAVWQLEDFKLDELEIPEESDLRESYRKLRQYSKDIAELKDVIKEQEQVVEELRDKITEDYKYDGELTDEGFKIGDTIFKPYRCHEMPLANNYERPNDQLLPSSVDLRKDFSSIRNQKHQGACSSFSLVSVMEFFLRRAFNEQTDLSEAFVYYNARVINNKTNEDSGSTFQDIIQSMHDKGVCLEALCPYDPNVYDEQPSEKAYSDAVSRRITEAKNVKLQVEDIKSALAKGYPVVISIRVFDRFVKNVNGFIDIPSESELKEEENHAMVVCGYSDSEGYFIVRNSWGTHFGDRGYCYLPYDYIRTPKLVNAAYVVTGLNIEGYEGKNVSGADSLLKDRDFNTQHVINLNILREKQRILEANRQRIKEMQKKYLELFNQLGNIANLDISLNEIKDKTDEQRRNLEQKLDIEIEKQKREQQQDKNSKRRFSFFWRKSKTPESIVINDVDEKPEIVRIKEELRELDSVMDVQRKKFRMQNAIFKGINAINQELIAESIRIQQMSDNFLSNIKRIDEQNKKDEKEYQIILNSNLLPIDKTIERLRNLPEVRRIFTSMVKNMRDEIKNKIGFYEILGDARNKLVKILLKNFNFNITEYNNDDYFLPFFSKIRHSAVMVQVYGGLPEGYGDETKFFFSNLSEKPNQLAKDRIRNLQISDNLRMSFLHIEKYNVEDLYMFREEFWKR
mgnify:CR=1 FL=1